MSIWKTQPVDRVPHIKLASWGIYEVSSELWEEKTRHFVGYNLTEREGRASSAIVEFDPVTKRGVTESGRVYELIGEAGHNGDGMYTFSRWCEINKILNCEEVTTVVFEQHT